MPPVSLWRGHIPDLRLRGLPGLRGSLRGVLAVSQRVIEVDARWCAAPVFVIEVPL